MICGLAVAAIGHILINPKSKNHPLPPPIPHPPFRPKNPENQNANPLTHSDKHATARPHIGMLMRHLVSGVELRSGPSSMLVRIQFRTALPHPHPLTPGPSSPSGTHPVQSALLMRRTESNRPDSIAQSPSPPILRFAGRAQILNFPSDGPQKCYT